MPIYKSTVHDDTLSIIEQMVQKSQESVKHLLCHNTTANNRLEFDPKNKEHYASLSEVMRHVCELTRGLNPRDHNDADEL